MEKRKSKRKKIEKKENSDENRYILVFKSFAWFSSNYLLIGLKAYFGGCSPQDWLCLE